MTTTWSNTPKTTTNVTWANTLLDWTRIFTWAGLAFFQNLIKH